LGYFIPKNRLCINFDKNGLGYILGDLFTNSSGFGQCIEEHSLGLISSNEIDLVAASRVARFFLGTKYQSGENMPNYHKIYQMAPKYFQ
jgi:hypothetical protein